MTYDADEDQLVHLARIAAMAVIESGEEALRVRDQHRVQIDALKAEVARLTGVIAEMKASRARDLADADDRLRLPLW